MNGPSGAVSSGHPLSKSKLRFDVLAFESGPALILSLFRIWNSFARVLTKSCRRGPAQLPAGAERARAPVEAQHDFQEQHQASESMPICTTIREDAPGYVNDPVNSLERRDTGVLPKTGRSIQPSVHVSAWSNNHPKSRENHRMHSQSA